MAERPGTVHGLEVVAATWRRRWPGDRPRTVFLNPGRMNRLATRLIEERHIPELSSYRLVRTEPRVGGSRFDAILEQDGEELLLEVKSVTLTERSVGMFPDARSERGVRHLEELGELARSGRRAAVLFLVQGQARSFLPDFHNDLDFARSLVAARETVAILPYRIDPRITQDERIVFDRRPQPLEIPWNVARAGCADGGLYLLVLEIHRRRRFATGALGDTPFEPGFHVYVGSAAKNLSRRIQRHLRRRKRLRWHVDELRNLASALRAFPIRGAFGECDLASDVRRIAADFVPRFGASDCRCPGHLVRFESDPVRNPEFQRLLTTWRHDAVFHRS